MAIMVARRNRAGVQHDGPATTARRRRGRLAAGSLAAALALAGCTGDGSGDAAAASLSSASSSASSSTGGAASLSGAAGDLQAQYEQVISHVLPSVVEIRTSVGLGSGVVLDRQGHIVTNAHVVGSATTFQVFTSKSATPLDATLTGTYPPNDLAVIQVADAGALQPATFADSSKVDVGEIVLAMGNPLGLSATVTNGIVSALGRIVSEPAENGNPGTTLPNTIQTSAAINPGNSGGALVDLRGQVVGIPTLVAEDPTSQNAGAAPGIGFAIPSNDVKRIAGQLASTGTVTDSGRAALGVTATTVTDASGQPVGVGVVSVTGGGAAEAAGVRAGDVIVAVNGQQTPTLQALGAVLAGLKVGQQVPVTVLRQGSQQKVQVTLGELGG